MSYAQNGYGAYYEFSPHQVFDGYGALDTANIRKSFNAAKVWSDAQLGGSIGQIIAQGNLMNCPAHPQTPDCIANRAEQGRANYAGGQAADQIRRALVELGYAEDLTVGVAWGGADRAAWEAFTSDQSLPAGPGLVNKVGIDRLGELLRGGEAPGAAKAGMSKMSWLMVAGAVGIGAIALMARGKRKRSGGMPLR